MPLTIPLQQAGTDDLALVGGKAANLAVLMRAGLPVPMGFCVTSAAFRQFLASCPRQGDLLRTLSQLSAAAPDQAPPLGEQALARLDHVAVPHAVEHAILTAWRTHGTECLFAVRSSATVEDGRGHSFAGLFESVLEVQGQDALLAAIKKCWLSLFSGRALAYHAKNRLPIAQSAMAVIVQEMVPADAAGVLFTIDPVTGDADRIVIEAAPGLGEAVVGGRVAPERMLLAKSSLTVVSRSTGDNVETKVKVLGDNIAQQLATLSRRVEAAMPGPLDIEWAIANGVIYLLQARPATGLQRVKTWAERQIWTNGKAGEAAPEPLTPMTYSMLMPFLQGLMDNLMAHLGLRLRAEELIALIAGRLYFNMNLGAALLRYLPGFEPEDISGICGGAHAAMIRSGTIRLQPEDLPRRPFGPETSCRLMETAGTSPFWGVPQTVDGSRA